MQGKWHYRRWVWWLWEIQALRLWWKVDTPCLSPSLEAVSGTFSLLLEWDFYLLLPLNMVCAISLYRISYALLLSAGGNQYLHSFSPETPMGHVLLMRFCCCGDEWPPSQSQDAYSSVVEMDIQQITVRCEIKNRYTLILWVEVSFVLWEYLFN